MVSISLSPAAVAVPNNAFVAELEVVSDPAFTTGISRILPM
jgi:hypothetical protein